MSHERGSGGSARAPFSRRTFLTGSLGVAAGAALWTPDLWNPARARSLHRTLAVAANPSGTTLAETIVLGTRANGSPYVRLTTGPGWPTVTRTELAALQAGREERRVALAAIVQLTDVHLVDAQSPGRVEFLDRLGDPYTGAFRPQEALTTHVQASMVQRINDVARGPITGRAFDCCVSTGDNIDNQQTNELDWFIAVLNGGRVVADSGKPGEFEGVQSRSWGDPNYWHPDGGVPDGAYGDKAFPRFPGMLDAAIAAFESPGLSMPWYSTYGNHDGLIQGNLPTSDAADAIFTGRRKITDLPEGMHPLAFIGDMLGKLPDVRARLEAGAFPFREVTPDDARRTVKTREWVQTHLDRPGRAGPAGHGYTDAHLEAPALHYSFEVAPGVLGISLDTGGYNSGSIGQIQLDWLEGTLRAAHSRHYDAAGNEVRTTATDQIVILFSHFTIGTMNGSLPDPANPGERRIEGDELVAFLHRWPNIVAWVNGHTHTNTITPVPDGSGRTNGFWEITTASHVDHPEHARVVEVVDNRDGTISIFTTMLEHAAPAATDPGDLSPRGLAAISRELAANDVGVDVGRRLGPVEALNVELALRAPFDLRAAGVVGAASSAVTRPAGTVGSVATVTDPRDESSSSTPVLVGAGAAVTVGAVAAGALALRRRGGGDRAATSADDREGG